MTLVVYAEASAGDYPGHMVVGQEDQSEPPRYFGYRFDPADLPEAYRPPERWREYLFNNAVPGTITDESRYVSLLLRDQARSFYEKRAVCDIPIESRLPPRPNWENYAWYSFNPDDQGPERQPCYNCVKWSVEVANGLVKDFLVQVPQGRLKRILEQLEKRSS